MTGVVRVPDHIDERSRRRTHGGSHRRFGGRVFLAGNAVEKNHGGADRRSARGHGNDTPDSTGVSAGHAFHDGRGGASSGGRKAMSWFLKLLPRTWGLSCEKEAMKKERDAALESTKQARIRLEQAVDNLAKARSHQEASRQND